MKVDEAGKRFRPAIAKVKFFAAIIFPLAALSACGSDGTANPKTPVAPQTTDVGTPTGSISSQLIGPNGGSVTSQDGMLTVTIPPGALSAAISVTVQPVSALAPAAVGAAYRLGPSGTTFGTPVSVVFHYDSTELIGTTPQLLWVVSQDSSGAWPWASGVTVDSTAHTVTVAATHFSDWSLVQGIQIRPPDAEVQPSATVPLQLQYCQDGAVGYDCDPPSDPSGEDLPPLPIGRLDPGSWAVNGINGGSAAYGTVTGSATGAIYTAPSEAPGNGNPVAVSVKIINGNRSYTLLSSIRVLDKERSYHAVGSISVTGQGIAALLIADVTDRVEFDITNHHDGSATVSHITNSPSTQSNVRLPDAAESSFCRFTVDSPFEFGTFDQFVGGVSGTTGGASGVVYTLSMGGTRTIATSSYYTIVNGACVLGETVAGGDASVGTTIEIDSSLFPQVGSETVIHGMDTNMQSDGWVFDLKRTQ